jgi:hypothetical protein
LSYRRYLMSHRVLERVCRIEHRSLKSKSTAGLKSLKAMIYQGCDLETPGSIKPATLCCK